MNIVQIPSFPTLSAVIAGSMILYTNSVFLSSSYTSTSLPLTTINAFSTRSPVSASFPSFQGIDITTWCKITKHTITININALNRLGLFFDSNNVYFDLIFFNVAGYSKLSTSGTLLFSPSVSGINFYSSSFYVDLNPNPIPMNISDTFASDNFLAVSGFSPWNGISPYVSVLTSS